MSKLFLFVSAAFLLVSCSPKNNDLYLREFTGDVSKVISSSYEADIKFGEVHKIKMEDDIWGYNNSITEFNEYGNITTITSLNGNGEVGLKDVYTYSEGDKIDVICKYNSDGELNSKTIHKWDGDFCQSIITFDKDDKETYKIISKNTGKDCVERTVYNNGELSQVIKVQTDGDKEITRTFDKEGQELSFVQSSKKFFEKLVYNNTTVIILERNKYNHIIKSENAEVSQCGFIVRGWNTDNKVYYYEYEYDDKHNWIKRTDYLGESRKPIRVIERVIEYR